MEFPEGTEGADEKLVMPGDTLEMVFTLLSEVALEEGSRFTIREGNKTIGTGIVTKLFD